MCVLCCLQSLKMLNDEETTDNELRTKFNQRWNRTPSGDLYKPLRAGTHTQTHTENMSVLFLFCRPFFVHVICLYLHVIRC